MAKLLVICGSLLKHRYTAIRLLQAYDDTSVIIEKHLATTSANYSEYLSPIITRHFDAVKETDRQFFSEFVESHDLEFSSKTNKVIERGNINTAETLTAIKRLDPALIVINGTSIVGSELLSLYPDRIINIHAGLCPYYRGVGSNVWPFYFRELEYVGMTIHLIDGNIDTGAILWQGRPAFRTDDTTHTIGSRNVILAADLIINVVHEFFQSGALNGVQQNDKAGRNF